MQFFVTSSASEPIKVTLKVFMRKISVLKCVIKLQDYVRKFIYSINGSSIHIKNCTYILEFADTNINGTLFDEQ